MPLDRDAYEVLQVHPKADQLIIQAAYRILAAKYHPDREASPLATRRMTELNAAYELVRTADRRELYDKQRQQQQSVVQKAIVPPYAQAAAAQTDSPDTLDFGRYAGWSIDQLARQDPDYLRWLSRHSSGIRFRRRIEAALAKIPPATRLRPEEREL
jgi:curved DNA-binding protein CbpA